MDPHPAGLFEDEDPVAAVAGVNDTERQRQPVDHELEVHYRILDRRGRSGDAGHGEGQSAQAEPMRDSGMSIVQAYLL